MTPRLFIIVPCYNEEAVLPITSTLFLSQLRNLVAQNKVSDNSRILFVDDGSSDSTWKVIRSLSQRDRHFCGIQQSRNRDH